MCLQYSVRQNSRLEAQLLLIALAGGTSKIETQLTGGDPT
jgi:hypothetical protein